MKVTALTPINHDGKDVAIGDGFEVDGAELLQLLDTGAVEAAGITSARSKAEAAAAAAVQAAADADAQAQAEAAAGNA
jgi:nucleoid-associated protein YgaU